MDLEQSVTFMFLFVPNQRREFIRILTTPLSMYNCCNRRFLRDYVSLHISTSKCLLPVIEAIPSTFPTERSGPL